MLPGSFRRLWSPWTLASFVACNGLPVYSEPLEAVARNLGPDAGYAEALCLDGGPGRYYFRSGHGSGASKFLIFFEGGSFCSSDLDCAERSGGYLGSTKNDSATMTLDYPFFATAQTESPLMWNWNHVYVRYCDGGYYSGARQQPKVVGATTIFFRGAFITEALFADLSANSGLGDATDVVLSGCSAGAIRVFAHLDALRALLPAKARVVGLPDSGFYLDLEMFTPLKRYVVVEQQATRLLNTACTQAFEGAEEKCLIGSVVSAYLQTPIFAVQSRFDTDQRTCEMDESCAASPACVNEYGANLTAAIKQVFLKNKDRGVFLDSCSRHCSDGDCGQVQPLDDLGMTQLQAFAAWYVGGASEYGQSATFPCSTCCSGAGSAGNEYLFKLRAPMSIYM
ncbi:unnamed protein product [Polarella glacialis]|uniref:Pectin acetylesterase n=1 Tax=Polarella glacialis TaxID=89957 RepID=A0A813JET8_POLGL|nr:unnamed protein product [Polarella glacialis]